MTGQTAPVVEDVPNAPSHANTIQDEQVDWAPCHLDGYDAQIVTRTVRSLENGQLLDFAVMLQVREEGDEAWLEVERIDCCHDKVHIDRYNRQQVKRKTEEVIPTDVRDDIDKAFKWSQDYIWDLGKRIDGWR